MEDGRDGVLCVPEWSLSFLLPMCSVPTFCQWEGKFPYSAQPLKSPNMLKPLYIWVLWLHMNIWAWKGEKVCSSIHQISVRTVHMLAVVQVSDS
jgi:hypothetical protein